MPERAARWWTFQGEAAADERAAQDLVTTVQRFALPFIESNRDLQVLAQSVRTNADEDSRAHVLPVIYRLMGQPRLAEQALDAELRADESEAGDSYRSFVERFMRT
jgi:MoxR-like ATPase